MFRCLSLYSAILVLYQFQYVHSANILFVSVTPSASHQKVFQPVWKELSLRGHNVHAVTTDPLRNSSLTNLTEYDLSSHYGLTKVVPQVLTNYLLQKPSFLAVFIKDIVMNKVYSILGEESFQHDEMQRLLRSDVDFDVVIVEWLFPTMSALAAKYKCPLIGISSLGAPLVGLDAVGNPSHPVISPDHNLPVTRDMTYGERIVSVLYSIFARTWYHLVVLPREDEIVKKYLGEDLPYIGDIVRNVSILLLNRSPVFHRPMPILPSIIELGSINLNNTKPHMNKELKTFMDKSYQGVIYFSLGSTIKNINLKKSTRNMILGIFKQLPYNVVLKWENELLAEKPDNVFITKWLPQLSILSHRNTKLFIMQGGLQSSEEAILAKVPIIGLPTVSDQVSNIDAFVKYGAGIALDLDYLTADEFNSTIHEVITNSSYKSSMKALARIFYDQPVSGLDRAIWWIEYVIKHKGARHLRSPIMHIPWWQYFMLDVMGLAISVFCLVLLVFYFVVKGLYLLLKILARWKYSRKHIDSSKKIK